jgi:hypothetical protein
MRSALTVEMTMSDIPPISVLSTDQSDLLFLRVASQTHNFGAAASTQEFDWAAEPSCPITAEQMSMSLGIQQEIYSYS